MRKRKHKDFQDRDYIKRKIRRLEKQLRRPRHGSTGHSSSSREEEYVDYHSRYGSESPEVQYTDSEDDHRNIPSSVVIPEASTSGAREALAEIQPESAGSSQPDNVVETTLVAPSTPSEAALSAPPPLPPDILEALGDPKGKPEVFEPKVQQEVSERWGRILTEGLNKELKQTVIDKVLIPENFTLAKAPKLNPEVSAVLTESSRNRDKRLEKAQQQLGIGRAGLTNVTSLLIVGEFDRIDLIKRLSEINQILLDLHFDNTINRRKLITPLLDKKFLNIIQEVKRDAFLFGENLGEKIVASKTAEKSGLQVKKPENRELTAKKNTHQSGNWRGPPRQPNRRQGGNRNRIKQPYRRPGQHFDRPQTSMKMGTKVPSFKTQ